MTPKHFGREVTQRAETDQSLNEKKAGSCRLLRSLGGQLLCTACLFSEIFLVGAMKADIA